MEIFLFCVSVIIFLCQASAVLCGIAAIGIFTMLVRDAQAERAHEPWMRRDLLEDIQRLMDEYVRKRAEHERQRSSERRE